MESHNHYKFIMRFYLVELHDIDILSLLVYNEYIVEYHEKEAGMIISFAGHSFLINHNEIKDNVKSTIRQIAIKGDEILCYLGGYGDFDNICTSACRELKTEGIKIKMFYITPYFSISEQNKINEIQSQKIYDGVIYPPIENVPPKFAISRRNEWMIKESDVVIVYVKHNYGGASRSLSFANRKKKTIINLYEK